MRLGRLGAPLSAVRGYPGQGPGRPGRPGRGQQRRRPRQHGQSARGRPGPNCCPWDDAPWRGRSRRGSAPVRTFLDVGPPRPPHAHPGRPAVALLGWGAHSFSISCTRSPPLAARAKPDCTAATHAFSRLHAQRRWRAVEPAHQLDNT